MAVGSNDNRLAANIIVIVIALSTLVGIGCYLRSLLLKPTKQVHHASQHITFINLPPPPEKPIVVGRDDTHSKAVVKAAGEAKAIPPAATTQQLTTTSPSVLRLGDRDISFHLGSEGGTGRIRLGGYVGPEFPWQTIVDQWKLILAEHPCVRSAPKNYQISAQIDVDHQLKLTRLTSTGSNKADRCTDEELDALAKTIETINVDGKPYRPGSVSIDVYHYEQWRPN
jgi:hypothetical protein